MRQAIKNIAKAPIIARYTWLSIMIVAMIFADQWGVAKHEIIYLLIVTVVYGVTIELSKRLFDQQQPWVILVGFIWDLLVWSVFIYYSGGATNPLITLFLTVIAVASVVMPTVQIIGLSIFSVALYSLLWYFFVPLSISHHDHAVGEKLHLLGMFGVFIFAAIMLTALTVYYKQAMSRSYQALEQAQQAIHQQRRLLAVSSLAANIAHEMSTPIASMQLLTEDIAMQIDEEDELFVDVQLLQSQIEVCRQSLATLKNHIQSNLPSTSQSQHFTQLASSNLQTLLPRVISEWRFLNPSVEVIFQALHKPLYVALNEEQLYSILINMLNNAMQAQASNIFLAVQTGKKVMITIEDNGQGIEQAIIDSINRQTVIESNNGWGLGLTIAKTVLEYVGGNLEITNLHSLNEKNNQIDELTTHSGTRVTLTLPISNATVI